MSTDPRAPSVLHVIVRVGATNSQYNEHCLPMLHRRQITVCSLHPASVDEVPPGLRLVEGDGTLRGSWRAIRRAVSMGPYDVVHAHAPSSSLLTLAALFVTRRSRANLVFTLHNTFDNFRLRSRLLLRVVLALFPTIVVCGHSVRDTLPRTLRRLTRQKLHVVPNGVDLDRVQRVLSGYPGRQHGGGFVVASVNRLIPMKDPFTTLRAFTRMGSDDSELVLVGDGRLRKRLARQISRHARQLQVRHTGVVPRDDVYRILADADVLVSTSKGEGLPVGVLEALACGCPVVLSDIPPHREIADSVPGIPLVRVGDVEGFARALQRMRAAGPTLRRELGARQQRQVAERHTVDIMNRAYGEIYMDVVQRNQQRRQRRTAPDQTLPIDSAAGLLAQLRRRVALVVACTLVGSLAGLGYALVRPTEFRATTSILVGNVIGGPADQETLDASASLAATYADVARREPVLEPLVARGFAPSWLALQARVDAEVGDSNPHLVVISVVARTQTRARQLAAAIAGRLVTMSERGVVEPGTEFSREQVDLVAREIVETQRRILATNDELATTTDIEMTQQLSSELTGLRRTISSLENSYALMLDMAPPSAGSGAQVTVLENAYASRAAFRPDATGLVGAGAAAGLTLAMGLVYLGAGRRNRRVPGGAREDQSRPYAPYPAAPAWADDEPLRRLENTYERTGR